MIIQCDEIAFCQLLQDTRSRLHLPFKADLPRILISMVAAQVHLTQEASPVARKHSRLQRIPHPRKPQWHSPIPSTAHCKSPLPALLPPNPPLTHPTQRPPPPPPPLRHHPKPQLNNSPPPPPNRRPPLLRRPTPHYPHLPQNIPHLPPLRLQPRRRLLPVPLEQ